MQCQWWSTADPLVRQLSSNVLLGLPIWNVGLFGPWHVACLVRLVAPWHCEVVKCLVESVQVTYCDSEGWQHILWCDLHRTEHPVYPTLSNVESRAATSAQDSHTGLLPVAVPVWLWPWTRGACSCAGEQWICFRWSVMTCTKTIWTAGVIIFFSTVFRGESKAGSKQEAALARQLVWLANIEYNLVQNLQENNNAAILLNIGLWCNLCAILLLWYVQYVKYGV